LTLHSCSLHPLLAPPSTFPLSSPAPTPPLHSFPTRRSSDLAAAHIDQLEAILPAVDPIAEKHRSLNIKPEHYPIVGKHLVLAMRDVLGEEVATDDVINACEKSYGEIANVVIIVEKGKHQKAENACGGCV